MKTHFEDLEKRVDSEVGAEVQGVEAQFRAGKARHKPEDLQNNHLSNSSLFQGTSISISICFKCFCFEVTFLSGRRQLTTFQRKAQPQTALTLYMAFQRQTIPGSNGKEIFRNKTADFICVITQILL